jgi:ATP-dependent DNA helicase RecG
MSMLPTTPEQLQGWLDAPEGSRLEFKEAKQSYHFDKLVDYCVALANEGGGKIILGVTDRRPRRIVGTSAFDEPGRTEAGLHDRLSHRIPVEELQTEQGRVLIVHVPPRLPGTAWHRNGRYLKRAGDELAPMDASELRSIFAETGPDFSAEVCPGAALDVLEPEAVADFRDRWARKTQDDRRSTWSVEETLTNAELLVDGKVTYAALILFGTRAALGRYLAQAEIVFEYRQTEASGPAADREEFREGFFRYHDALWNKVNLRNDRQSYQDGLFRIELPTFDEVPVREALLNAVAHRDYRHGGSVFVRQFPQRLEVVSPGGFPPGITPENVLDQQNPRNRRLSEALAKCGLIERAGQGMNLMFERAIRQGKPLPSFEGTSPHQVRLTLEGAVQDPVFVRFLERLGQERLRSFSTYDFLILDHLRREQPVPPHLKGRLPALIEVGAIESQGRGRGMRYLLSRRLYAALGRSGTATRVRGLDTPAKKALLSAHLRAAGDAGPPMSELRQVLPSDSVASIRRMLDEMRAAGLVRLRGQRRWARWYATPAMPQNGAPGV